MSKKMNLVVGLLIVMLSCSLSVGAMLSPYHFVSFWNGAGYENYAGWNSLSSTAEYIGWAGGATSEGGIPIYNYFAKVNVGADDFSMGQTATLNVNVVSLNNVGFGLPLEIKIHPLTAPYVIGQASYLTASTGVNWANPGGDYVSSVFAALTLRDSSNVPLGLHQADVTSLMEYWESNPNYGMVFVCDVSVDGGSRSLGFENHPTASPFIEVVPEPTTLLLIAAGGLLIRRRK